MEEYFAGLLGGVEKRVMGRKRRAENNREKKEKLGREEVRRAIKNIMRKWWGWMRYQERSGSMGGGDRNIAMEFLQQNMEGNWMA